MLRMSSYMSRGQKLIEAGKTPDAMRLVTRGFQHYAERVLKAIQPYAKADACMLVFQRQNSYSVTLWILRSVNLTA